MPFQGYTPGKSLGVRLSPTCFGGDLFYSSIFGRCWWVPFQGYTPGDFSLGKSNGDADKNQDYQALNWKKGFSFKRIIEKIKKKVFKNSTHHFHVCCILGSLATAHPLIYSHLPSLRPVAQARFHIPVILAKPRHHLFNSTSSTNLFWSQWTERTRFLKRQHRIALLSTNLFMSGI